MPGAADVVPEIVPVVGFIDMPGGNDPPVTANVDAAAVLIFGSGLELTVVLTGNLVNGKNPAKDLTLMVRSEAVVLEPRELLAVTL